MICERKKQKKEEEKREEKGINKLKLERMEHGTEKQLYDAALIGNVTTFQQLLQQDPLLLDRVSLVYCPNTTPPLHIATLMGNLRIVEEVLKRNPQLAQQLDSQKSSPLHIAAAQGFLDIASQLLSAAPNMCWQRDCHGMNPVHIAAMNGHALILRQLVEKEPVPARERVDNRQTALHLCVKRGHLSALVVLVNRLGELVSAEDDQSDTILHLAARCSQIKIIKYLVENEKIKTSIRNSKGLTAYNILLAEQLPTTEEIEKKLLTWSLKPPYQEFEKFRDIGMVIATLIATMAFQAVISPPGGVWQDDSSTHRAGAAVMAYTHPKIYKQFVRVNAVAFISSLINIVVLITGLPSIHMLGMLAVMLTMLTSLASIAVSYGASVTVISPNYTDTQPLAHVIRIVVAVSVSTIGLNCVRMCILAWNTFKMRRRRLFQSQVQD